MMNYLSNQAKFEIVKQSVDICEVANRYGIRLNRMNKAVCPFHNEKTASFSINKNKQIYKCFGCGSGGDVLSLVSNLMKVNAYEAAKIINNDFGCGVDFGKPVNRFIVNGYKQKKEITKQFKEWIKNTFIILTDYYRELKIYKQDPRHPRFVEALQQIDKIEYYIDFLMVATEDEEIEFWKRNKKVVEKIASRQIG